MSRFLLALILGLLTVLAGCTCSAEKGAVKRLQDQEEKIFQKYLGYVDHDPSFGGAALSEDQRKKARDDERALLQSIRDIVQALRVSLGD